MKLPIFIEDSKVPVFLSYFAPITIWAINIGPFVWCRGKYTESLKQHEAIHWAQQKECLIVGQWALYILFWLYYVIKFKGNGKDTGKDAYRAIPFEQEAFRNEYVKDYLKTRKRYEWLRYLK
tara:strand:+ start:35 stop:400 length:366 start_codon:yes stop_codon:yes gene_type:complete